VNWQRFKGFHQQAAARWSWDRLTEGTSTAFDAVMKAGRGLYSEAEMREHFSYDLYNNTSYLVDEGEIRIEILDDPLGTGVLEVQLFAVGKYYYFVTTFREEQGGEEQWATTAEKSVD